MSDLDLLFRVGAETGNFEAAMGRVGGMVGKFGMGLLGLGSAVAILGKLANEALNDEVAFTRLKTAMSNTADGSTKLFKQMKDISGQMELTAGFTQGDMAGALTKLVQTTGSSTVAMKSIGAAMELARAKGMDLEQAAGLVGRAYEKGTTAISRQTQMYGENKKGIEAVDAINKKFAGNVAAYAATDKGELASTLAVFLDIGAKGIKPLVSGAADMGKGLAEAAQKSADKFKPFQGIIDKIVMVFREFTGVVIPTFVYALITLVGGQIGRIIVLFKDLGQVIGDVFTGKWDKVMTDAAKVGGDFANSAKKDFKDVADFAIQRQKEETAAIKAGKKEEVAVSKDAADEETELSKLQAKDINAILTDVAALKKTKSKQMFEIGKAASIAGIIVSTAESGINAFNSLSKIPFVGPALGIAAAAAAAVAGGVALSEAQGATFNPSGAEYGIMGGFNEPLMTTLKPTEIVVPQKFSEGIARGDYALTGKNETNNSNSSNTSIHINVPGYVDQRSLDRVVREQIVPAIGRYNVAKGVKS